MENALKRGFPLLLLLAATAAFGTYQSPASTPPRNILSLPSFQSQAPEPLPELLLVYDEQGTLDTIELRPDGTPAVYTYEAIMCLGEPARSEGRWSQNGVTFPEGNKLQDGATTAFAGWSGIGFWGHNRYYDPELGRFTQTDPMGYADSMNLYQAFNQSPQNFSDPMGEDIVVNTKEAAIDIVRILNNIFDQDLTLKFGFEVNKKGGWTITGDIEAIRAKNIFGRAIAEWMMPKSLLKINYREKGTLHSFGGAYTPEAPEGDVASIEIDPTEAYSGLLANRERTAETTLIHELSHTLQIKHPIILSNSNKFMYGRLELKNKTSDEVLFLAMEQYSKSITFGEQFALYFEYLYRKLKNMPRRTGYLNEGEYTPPKPSATPVQLWNYEQ